MSIRINVQGIDGVEAALRRYGKDVENELGEVVDKVAITIRTEVQKAISRGGRTGIVYKRGKKTHQASAPGEPPKTDTGFLVNQMLYNKPDRLTAEIGNNAKYAEWLEYGTARMKARPIWLPTTEKYRPIFQKMVRDVVVKYS